MAVYCERCDNIMDLTRTKSRTLDIEDRPKVLVNYEDILKKLESKQPIPKDVLASIDVKEMMKSEYYNSIQGKGQIKKTLMNMIEDAQNSDEDIHAYLLCTNCQYSKPLDKKFHVLSKNPEGAISTYGYENESIYRNMVYQRTVPRTREFKCPNKECATNKGDTPSEAAFFRKTGTYQIIYVCVACHTIKRN